MSDEQELPFNQNLIQQLTGLDSLQLAWLSGYCWAKAKGNSTTANIPSNETPKTEAENSKPLKITILSASQTGNAKGVATALAERLKQQPVSFQQFFAKDYKAKNIADEELLLFVTSTQGDGEPPEEAVALYKFLHSKKAPNLSRLEYAVLGLGDSSYPHFCQAGKDFDKRFAELGATPLIPRVDADLDFQNTANEWIEQIVQLISQKSATKTQVKSESNTIAAASSQYSRANPFNATLLTNQKITARNAEKDIRHIEFDLADSGLSYQVGDALGVWFENDPALIMEIIEQIGLTGDEKVEINAQSFLLKEALRTQFEITQSTPAFVKGYAKFAENAELSALVEQPETLAQFIQNRPIISVLHQYPAKLTETQFIGLLRPLAPRLYSISSAQAEVGEEVHLTVGLVQFEQQGKVRKGAGSSYLAERVNEDTPVKIFIEKNDHFRLPQDNSKPIIMIGSGTGIAPFRAFIQQRAADEATGKNWLIFGNQRFTQDFLYQTEWQQFAKDGYLHQYDFAWSRDQKQKIYVQDKIRERAELIWQWLQNGAYLYVCGDASKMAKDVEKALLDVIAEQGKLNADDAEDYLNQLRENQRYQRDVY
ncbi:sulfite reductase subunit alpha [Pasteurellaceae bacterium LFhippo2]|nr:sulfite reductase subunit alpha [Pasteurellaceae bacterium LFhippo2]